MHRVVSLVSCAVAALMSLDGVVHAQATPDFSGKTVTIIASFEAGGPYDFYARLVARHIGAHLPGRPNVVVQNMPGAGGLRGANYIYNVAVKDGTAMGVVSQTVAVGQVLGTTPGIQYDTRAFNWIGRMNANVEVDHAWHASGVRSIQDVMAREVVAAGTGPSSSSVERTGRHQVQGCHGLPGPDLRTARLRAGRGGRDRQTVGEHQEWHSGMVARQEDLSAGAVHP